jgi:hypothetical protein
MQLTVGIGPLAMLPARSMRSISDFSDNALLHPHRPALHRTATHANPRRTTKRKVPPDRTWPSWERHGSAQCVADLHCRCRQQLSGLGLNGLCSTLSTVPVSCNASTTESRGIPSSMFGREDASRTRSGCLLVDPWCSVLSVMPTTLCEAIGL